MIRRDDGNDWLLISQIDHARLAADIATVWGRDEIVELPNCDQLVTAIRKHDDGWRDWELTPQIDPVNGRPRSFTEMPMDVATGIWNQSIEVCRADSALAAAWVSRHFCELGERARENRDEASADIAAIDRFLNQQATQLAKWRNEIPLEASGEDVESLVETGYKYVQFFDWLSLWICCARRSQPTNMTIPAGKQITLTPCGDTEFAIAPFPLSIDRLPLTVTARRIPASKYSSDSELHTAIAATPVEHLNWTLVAPSA